MVNLEFAVRPARTSDQNRIANLIYFEPNIHRHLDWRTPLEWLGAPEYWVAEQEGQVLAALACPPDPENIAWVRLFVHSSLVPAQEAWRKLWQTAHEALAHRPDTTVAAIVLQGWFKELLLETGFRQQQEIVMLEHSLTAFEELPIPAGFSIRQMNFDDLPAVARLDAAAFAPLWQNSLKSLQHAFSQAGPASVAIAADGQIIGYQVSTKNPFGAHLARLAVHPILQGRNLGYVIVQELLRQLQQGGVRRLTVNTQSDNRASLALYRKIGFVPTGERYSVFIYRF
jgi:ribosomal protein S18 acetylase RimI-like enzyme